MSIYTSTTEADRLEALFAHADIDLDAIIERAISVLVENSIMELDFHDGSQIRIPVVSYDSRYAA